MKKIDIFRINKKDKKKIEWNIAEREFIDKINYQKISCLMILLKVKNAMKA